MTLSAATSFVVSKPSASSSTEDVAPRAQRERLHEASTEPLYRSGVLRRRRRGADVGDPVITAPVRKQLSLFDSVRAEAQRPFVATGKWIRGVAAIPDSSTALKILRETAQAPSETGLPQSDSDFLVRRTKALFAAAREERFEEGVASKFSQDLVSLVEAYGDAGLAGLEAVLADPRVNAEIAAEALKWLPFVRGRESYKYRMTLLKNALLSSSIRVRDAAVMGLASMDDQRALDVLLLAIDREECEELREQMNIVKEQLERTRRAALSEAH